MLTECVYWASKASPTLGCSIEISRDIYNMFRTDAQLCPVTQPVVQLHNRPSRYPTGSDKQELGGDTLPAEILFTGEWCYPYLLGCAEDLGVWV